VENSREKEMKIQPVKGTRDFYPQDMAIRNWIIDGWKKVSVRNGFEEYDGPIFEYLRIFQIKSGNEIVEQLFSFTDRGKREIAIRPEITPTLARMVNQRINSLPKPIKWFSIPRLCRAERPQKGRLREFFQWNVDMIGVNDILADAEVIFCALDYLQAVGLTPDDIVVRISSRKLLAAFLKRIGIPEELLDSLYIVLDKKDKIPLDTFRHMLYEHVPNLEVADKIENFMEIQTVSKVKKIVETNAELEQATDELSELMLWLNRIGVGNYCKFDPGIVRGLAYYTGIVYEIYDKAGELRAIGGGGRYNNLLRDFGGPDVPATGFGIGDCVLAILLEKKGLIKPGLQELDYFVACVATVHFDSEKVSVSSTPEDEVVKLTAKLRRLGFKADFSYKFSSLSKQLGEASNRNARNCIIIGEEYKNNELVIKNMATGRQKLVKVDRFFAELES
jgi:histidyl-tRNA synthetase